MLPTRGGHKRCAFIISRTDVDDPRPERIRGNSSHNWVGSFPKFSRLVLVSEGQFDNEDHSKKSESTESNECQLLDLGGS